VESRGDPVISFFGRFVNLKGNSEGQDDYIDIETAGNYNVLKGIDISGGFLKINSEVVAYRLDYSE
jgi:hypothetical protein